MSEQQPPLPDGSDPNAPPIVTVLNSDCPCPDKMLTVLHAIKNNGRLFKSQEQYCWDRKETVKEYCGPCQKWKMKTYYRVIIDGVEYSLNEKYVVESRDPIDKGEFGQDFDARLAGITGMEQGELYHLPPDRSEENRKAFNKVIM